jgi:hypothetical protein
MSLKRKVTVPVGSVAIGEKFRAFAGECQHNRRDVGK